jgi:glutamate racemase
MAETAHPYLAPIGIFDSGVGGLSVLRAIRQQLPGEAVIYLGDQAHVPYGPRPMAEVQAFCEAITHYLLWLGAKLIVVACNTASAAALHHLRRVFPQISFVGMEPAVKPAAEHTKTGVVGVLATPATFQGALYASVVERFGQGVQFIQDTCPGLVGQIEAGALDGPETREILERALRPMLASHADTVVMGCTHYPFVIPLIQEIAGPGVRVIDPAPAIAAQTRRLLEAQHLLSPFIGPAPLHFLTSGDQDTFQAQLPRLLGESGSVEGVKWNQDPLGLSPIH